MIRAIKKDLFSIGSKVKWSADFSRRRPDWWDARMEIIAKTKLGLTVEFIESSWSGHPVGYILKGHPRDWFSPVTE